MEKNKKTVAYLACDIEGTITHHMYDDEESMQAYMAFPELLELIRKAHCADELVFSFFTDANEQVLKEYMSKIAQYFVGTNIVMGNQHCKDKSFDKDGTVVKDNISADKIDRIAGEVDELQKDANVTWVGFADNDLIYHPNDVQKFESKFSNTANVTFSPVEIVALVSSLSNYLHMSQEELETMIPNGELLDFDNPTPKSEFNL